MRREFSPYVRKLAFIQAKFRCEHCDGKNELQLHHMGDPADNSLFNAQVLCNTCHGKVHQRRKRWMATSARFLGQS